MKHTVTIVSALSFVVVAHTSLAGFTSPILNKRQQCGAGIDPDCAGTIITSCKTPGTMALTFDDGPDVYTSQLLDILKSYNVTATFFIAGNNRDKGPMDDPGRPWAGVLGRMYNEGHQLASHTWTHRNLNKVNRTIQYSEIVYNEMAFRNIFGWFPTYMRPPYLECNVESGCRDTLRTLGYHIVNSNIDTKDYLNGSPENIRLSKERFEKALSRDPSRNGYITLAHDVHYQTVVTLTPYMIELSRERGYKLTTVGECLDDARRNWYRSTPNGPRAPSSTKTAPTRTTTASGSGDTHCGTGCDVDFGTCSNVPPGISDTTNGLCGARFSATCLHFGSKTCCSANGF
ncbi:hypothetical protein MY1884_003002, partial [Beauveria asiatica]